MFDKLKKNGVKYLVFAINILLAAIAVLVIREKDQARLLEKAQMENVGSGSEASSQLPSFKSSVSVEENSGAIDQTQVPPVDSGENVSAEPDPQNIVPAAPTPVPVAPAPVPQTKPSNAKTKTS